MEKRPFRRRLTARHIHVSIHPCPVNHRVSPILTSSSRDQILNREMAMRSLTVLVLVHNVGYAEPESFSTRWENMKAFCSSSFYANSSSRANVSLANLHSSNSEGTCRCYRAGMIGGWCLPALLIIGKYLQIVNES